MWPTANRAKTASNQNQKRRDRVRRPLHIKSVRAEVRSNDDPSLSVQVKLLLNDLSTSGIGLFSTQALPPGKKITLILEQPKPTELHGKVVWCRENITESHILTEKPFSYRMGIKFYFDSTEQQQQAGAYFNELAQTQLYTRCAA